MTRNIHNWSFRDVVDVLKDNDFAHTHTEGSHFFYTKKTAKGSFQVCVPFHGAKSIKSRTMKGIILQSGISKKVWMQ